MFNQLTQLMRLHAPIGWWLLLLPCWWSLALAGAPLFPEIWKYFLFFAGAVIMRGAGCIVNDIVDRDIDKQVERTRTRPIASGAITLKQAYGFLALLLLLGFAILLQFNKFTWIVGLASVPLIVIYPFMKRLTWWPQAVLGLTFSWGALMGWAAMTGGIDMPAILLYLAAIAWTIGYDTIYAHQDITDDEKIGVKSTARLFGLQSIQLIKICYAVFFVLLLFAGLWAGLSIAFYLAMLAVGGHLLWQLKALDVTKPDVCLDIFRANRETGLLVFIAILAGQL